MRSTNRQAMVTLLSGALLMGGAACSSRAETKEAAAATAPMEGYASITIQDLVQTDRFRGQKVLFEAAVSKIGCVSCGGVTVVDKTWRISVCPENPGRLTIPTTAGTRVRIWGVLSIVDDFREVKAQQVEIL
jgi:hypothetical protein